MSTEAAPLNAKDFATDQDVRWCPGCGDYSILKQVQSVMPDLGIPRENIVFISGIGCSSRFPYYMNTYGMHSIHGRATAIASGLKMMRKELSVWIITGDGDGLSIGGNHLIHLLRRNLNVNILLFNNEIYGLTKGQYSPTSEMGKNTKSSPWGTIDHPFNPLALALGADATFVARGLDRDPKHMREMLLNAHQHEGTSLLEIYQNCNVFNDGAFEPFSNKSLRDRNTLMLTEGQPLFFGEEDDKQVMIIENGKAMARRVSDVAEDQMWVHDPSDPYKAHLLSRLFDPTDLHGNRPRPFGVLYQEDRLIYEEALEMQFQDSVHQRGSGDLDAILKGENHWEIK
jgi:2-oxoglutarate ferredoxin oxidoreductase subunit beta